MVRLRIDLSSAWGALTEMPGSARVRVCGVPRSVNRAAAVKPRASVPVTSSGYPAVCTPSPHTVSAPRMKPEKSTGLTAFGLRASAVMLAVVLRPQHAKLVLNIEVEKSTLSIISTHTAINPFSEAIIEEIGSAGLRGGEESAMAICIDTTSTQLTTIPQLATVSQWAIIAQLVTAAQLATITQLATAAQLATAPYQSPSLIQLV
ncbi:hypothetical protein EVAR_56866_1 [Eumeta japonica]|uniref:Uncharacterized protein n=1 Tax=Eumeta variegata TaxID=151549 RepID=A0A4C1YX60_EUMVA|nr:hypothetical protein EVAR_56866_1 [Eumeta japonica]